MKYKCCNCGIEINEGEYKTFGICDSCWGKKYSKKLANQDVYSMLTEVREIAANCTVGLERNYMDYQLGRELLNAMRLINKKLKAL